MDERELIVKARQMSEAAGWRVDPSFPGAVGGDGTVLKVSVPGRAHPVKAKFAGDRDPDGVRAEYDAYVTYDARNGPDEYTLRPVEWNDAPKCALYEWAEGPTLDEAHPRDPNMVLGTIDDVLEIVLRWRRAGCHLWDLNPSNLVWRRCTRFEKVGVEREYCRPVLIDAGRAGPSARRRNAPPGGVCVAPEARSDSEGSRAETSDIFSVGAIGVYLLNPTLYRTICKLESDEKYDEVDAIVASLATRIPPSVRPTALGRALRAMVEASPRDRAQTVEEARALLSGAIRRTPRRPSLLPLLWAGAAFARQPVAAVVGLGAVAAVVAVLASTGEPRIVDGKLDVFRSSALANLSDADPRDTEGMVTLATDTSPDTDTSSSIDAGSATAVDTGVSCDTSEDPDSTVAWVDSRGSEDTGAVSWVDLPFPDEPGYVDPGEPGTDDAPDERHRGDEGSMPDTNDSVEQAPPGRNASPVGQAEGTEKAPSRRPPVSHRPPGTGVVVDSTGRYVRFSRGEDAAAACANRGGIAQVGAYDRSWSDDHPFELRRDGSLLVLVRNGGRTQRVRYDERLVSDRVAVRCAGSP